MSERRARRGALRAWVPGALVTGLLLVGLSACGGSSRPDPQDAPAGYRAVPDDELFAALGRLPGVRRVDVSFVDELGQGPSYKGDVFLRSDSDQNPRTVADHVAEVLFHGRWGAGVMVIVNGPGDRGAATTDLGLILPQDLVDRYGKQTGEQGWPPSFVPAG